MIYVPINIGNIEEGLLEVIIEVTSMSSGIITISARASSSHAFGKFISIQMPDSFTYTGNAYDTVNNRLIGCRGYGANVHTFCHMPDIITMFHLKIFYWPYMQTPVYGDLSP